ncbi:MAG TPA: PQQ-dependent sugar dehydrogenase [Tepidisphaeraceae bacterium]|nr:PQQ-dependent sugar dehydrogenase [Tepidisphaeraceae bacterium]
MRLMTTAVFVLTWISASALLAAAAATPAAAATQSPKISLRQVVKGLSSPVEVVTDGTGRTFVVEQPGRIRQFTPAGQLTAKPYLDISDHVTHQGECGFLGVAFHPNFKTNGFFYVNYTTGRGRTLRTVISEFRAASPGEDGVDAKTERVILEIRQPYSNHNGGQVAFGPDGMLYIGMGDGGSANDPQNRAQNPQELLGKILRIDVAPREKYAVPPDNPFVGQSTFRPEIWAWGLRNPWRFRFDRKTGTLFTGDVGQNQYEEIHVIEKGGNYGWRIREAMHPFRGNEKPPVAAKLIDPIAEYGRDKGGSVTGGVVYRGKQFPALEGIYFYADYVSGRFWGLKYDSGKVLANHELTVTVNGNPTLNRVQPSGFGEDPDGEIYVCDHSHGVVYQIVAE